MRWIVLISFQERNGIDMHSFEEKKWEKFDEKIYPNNFGFVFISLLTPQNALNSIFVI